MEEKRFVVTKDHRTNYPETFLFYKGEEVRCGEEDSQCENWIWCQKMGSDDARWVPKQILHITGDTATIMEEYNARELTVHRGEKVTALHELNGWMWCVTSRGERGWIPKENLDREKGVRDE
jgi:hypothetical protein